MKPLKRTIVLLLALLAGSAPIFWVIYTKLRDDVWKNQTFRCSYDSNGRPLQSGQFVDVIGTEYLVNGQSITSVIASRVLIVDFPVTRDDDHSLHQDITLKVTSAQAEVLASFQRNGKLHCTFCRQDESRPVRDTMRQFLQGSPAKVTAQELKVGVTDDENP